MDDDGIKPLSPSESSLRKQCYICDKIFLTLDKLQRHLKVNHFNDNLLEMEMGGKTRQTDDKRFRVKNFDDLFQPEVVCREKSKEKGKKIRKMRFGGGRKKH